MSSMTNFMVLLHNMREPLTRNNVRHLDGECYGMSVGESIIYAMIGESGREAQRIANEVFQRAMEDRVGGDLFVEYTDETLSGMALTSTFINLLEHLDPNAREYFVAYEFALKCLIDGLGTITHLAGIIRCFPDGDLADAIIMECPELVASYLLWQAPNLVKDDIANDPDALKTFREYCDRRRITESYPLFEHKLLERFPLKPTTSGICRILNVAVLPLVGIVSDNRRPMADWYNL